MPNGLDQATNFALDIQEFLSQRKQCMSDGDAMQIALEETLPKYPGCKISDVLTFSDDSVAKFTVDGFIVERAQKDPHSGEVSESDLRARNEESGLFPNTNPDSIGQ